MEIQLSEETRRYIEDQLATGRYRTPAELIADLVRRQKEQDAGERWLWDRQRQALRSLLDELAELPAALPNDGLTNRDHDRILYGGEA
jgi:putative addiction module CopG family antidote